MKYIIKEIKDELALSQEKALQMAQEQLKKARPFAVIYGMNRHGKKEFHTPILVDESTLKAETENLLHQDPNGKLYVLYKGTHLDSLKVKDLKGKILYHNPASEFSPEETEVEIYSEITGKVIDDPEDLWQLPTGEIGSYKEVRHAFMEEKVSRILPKGTEEYEKAKQYMIENYKYTPEEIEKAEFVKIYLDNKDVYDDMKTWDIQELMSEAGYEPIDPTNVDVDYFDEREIYDPDYLG